MKAFLHRLLPLLFALTLPFASAAQTAPGASAPAHPQVLLRTSMGDITLELYPDKAPKSVANFLQYVRSGFYNGTVFHRVIPGYLVQGGLYTRELQPKRTRSPVPNEADNGLSNLRGTVAVARGSDPNSGTAQFFINLVDNRRLDYAGNQSSLTWGYAVFGRVVKGMDVVDKIAALPTRGLGPFVNDVPDPLVVIESASVVGETAPAPASSVAAAPTTPKTAAPAARARHP
ncbi:peptidylprolyl isomerase [Aerosticca soli]|jgi:peptidyl-prolyl cis-trans isomerase A (cyclophilin A)|uniref:Peptidyl-prolyl cis-trans isomerase n=1 Tax=Aerosticca soli TaxID=2010829 RepID=A0A2Z6E6A2_9GAMM|nr:peptidylprolyl isomerase [Aerosticca soli]MDI3261534.1 peptidylprolyl isomerase [Fulvimonas sp.]BBD80009.1 peptidyl-prolyl cis-trans isomerase PpiA precursor [Aerosticca soli]